MSLLGFAPHQLAASRVVGISPISTWQALRLLHLGGVSSGWLLVDGVQPQFERVASGVPTRVQLDDLFVDHRVAATEGVASGRFVFAGSGPATPPPPADRDLRVWAEDIGCPWLEESDNDSALLGNLSDAQIDLCLAWFVGQMPLAGDWRERTVDAKAAAILRAGLFDHGWSRNLSLAKDGRSPTVALWGGVHERSRLPHQALHLPSQVQRGVQLKGGKGVWTLEPLRGDCPINDDDGRLKRKK